MYLKKFLKFDWEYQDIVNDGPQPEPEFILPSNGILKALLDVAQTGEVMRLQEELAELARTDCTLGPFVSKLSRMLEKFKFNDICRLLEKYLYTPNLQ